MTYTLERTGNIWKNLSISNLKRIVQILYKDHDWPDNNEEFLEELSSFDPQGIYLTEEE